MSMRITYTLESYDLRETSKGRGILTYHLSDKNGGTRTVSAIVKMGFQNKIKAMHALHHRETPLIKVLQKASISETIDVDFTAYNEAHPRASTRPVAVKNTSLRHEENKYLIDDMESLSDHKYRVMQMIGVGALAFVAIMSVKFSFFS